MPKSDRKKQRRLAAQKEEERRQREREQRSPLSRRQLNDLLDLLSERIMRHGHDGTMKTTSGYLRDIGVDVGDGITFFTELGFESDYDVAIGADPNVLFGTDGSRKRRMPIERKDLEDLIDWLDDEVGQKGCQNDLRLTRAWLKSRNLPDATTEIALLALGGGCDCEVVLNVDPDEIYEGN